MYEQRAVLLEKIHHLEDRIENVQKDLHKDEYLGENYHKRTIELERLEQRLGMLYGLFCQQRLSPPAHNGHDAHVAHSTAELTPL